MAAEHTFDKPSNITGPHSAFVHLDDGLFQPAISALVRLKYMGLERALAITRYLKIRDVAVFGMQSALVVAVTTVVLVFWVFHKVLNLSPHNGLQVFFNKLSDKIFK
ncbi:hypothetical protein D1872_197670 [compost metagenome]